VHRAARSAIRENRLAAAGFHKSLIYIKKIGMDMAVIWNFPGV
jgi:hypothetical protein